ncbi:MAG: hypothetical protein ACOCW9_09795 [Thermodesulfobacteriota bacterium]
MITLDADTQLPRETARRLVGTLAHPLNRLRFDPQTGEGNSGYTILQPRTEVRPVSANRSLFFDFECLLFRRTPENTLLNHDLFEGLHVRIGLASDIVSDAMVGAAPLLTAWFFSPYVADRISRPISPETEFLESPKATGSICPGP